MGSEKNETEFFDTLSSLTSSSSDSLRSLASTSSRTASSVAYVIHPLVDPLISSVSAHPWLVSGTAVASSSLTLTAVLLHARYFRRIRTAEWVTPTILSQKRWIKGRVTSVGDADNFRLFHTPIITWGRWRIVPNTNPELKDRTIHIRIAGVDAPEAAHFGRPAQPYSAEALEWLKKEVEGRTVYCQLLRRDQYGRIVATAVLPHRIFPFWLASGRCVGLEMLRAGYAVTYTQAGAEYGKWGLEDFQRAEADAQKAKRGMWAKGTSGESPTEYKKRYAKGVEESEQAKPKEAKQKSAWLPPWLTWKWFR